MRILLSLIVWLCATWSAVAQDLPTSPEATVPRLDITLADGVSLSTIHQHKDTYQACTIKVEGGGGFPDLASTKATIKGRGNTTWSMAKKPYRFKFDKKTSILGLPKGKSWVLLANFLDAAQLNNPVAMYIARQVGTAAANHIVPVELYVNGEYLGLYNLTEQVGISDISVKAKNEETCALLELDEYDGGGNRKNAYRLPVSVKDPDQEDYEELMEKKYKKLTGTDLPEQAVYVKEQTQRFYNTLNEEFAALTTAVEQGDFDECIDIPSLVRYFMVYDFIGNLEFQHPKSTYVHRQDIFDKASPWVFGPVWDCDWAYGYEGTRQYCVSDPEFDAFEVFNASKPGNRFFRDLLNGSDKVRTQYLTLWREYMSGEKLNDLKAYIDQYQRFIRPATERDYERWKKANSRILADYSKLATSMQSWLERRARYILEQLESEAHTINHIAEPALQSSQSTDLYDLAGRRVQQPTSGLYISKGRKVLR